MENCEQPYVCLSFLDCTFLKISFRGTFPTYAEQKTKDEIIVRAKGEIRTKEEPKKNQGTSKEIIVRAEVTLPEIA